MDFSFGFGLGSSAYLLSGYNPLINYDWSTTTTSGLRYLKDVGSTPTYNASMYFGRGAYFNGVDQTITVPINTTIQTALKRVNGVVTISETSQTLTNYVISGLGVHKDYYLFTRLLTTAEKDSYTNTPELFYAMAQSDNTCVLNMPMCETDGYARNMKSYSGISVGSDFNNNLLTPFYAYYGDATASVLDGKVIVTASLLYGNLRTTLSNSKKYYIKIVVSEVDSLDWYLFNNKYTQIPIIGVGSYSSIISESDIIMVQKRSNGGVSTTIKLDSFEILELSGIYPITNYTSSVRDNAKNLRYGLQTCKFVRDSLGVIQSASNYLECDGVGYADTGWKPIADEDWTLEVNYNISGYSGSYFGTDLSYVRMGEATSGKARVVLNNVITDVAATVGNIISVVLVASGDVYINKVFQKSVNMAGFAPAYTFAFGSVGAYVGLGINAFRGVVSKFKLHNKLLTNEEIQAL